MTLRPRRVLAVAALPLILAALTGCSSGGDYSADDGTAAVKYMVAHSSGALPDPMPPADQKRTLKLLHLYCEGVRKTSISNMESAFQGDAGALMQGAAERYCPSIMTSAKD